MLITPDYFMNFKCTAGKCQHNCCIGWEIDIDDDTFKKYSEINGTFGEKLKTNIETDGCAHFRLDENERCPFLNHENLCEIILNLGENSLCQICTDHPRFRNYFDDRTEMGLGLCCEAAAELILSKETKTIFTEYKSDDIFTKTRNKIYSIIQDRTFTIQERISNLLDYCSLPSPLNLDIDWKNEFLNLEILDPNWSQIIAKMDKLGSDNETKLQIPYEQLLVYLVYRHLAPCAYDGMFSERILFIILSYYIIKTLNKKDTLEDLIDISRMYSSEIEYSTENIDILLDLM